MIMQLASMMHRNDIYPVGALFFSKFEQATLFYIISLTAAQEDTFWLFRTPNSVTEIRPPKSTGRRWRCTTVTLMTRMAPSSRRMRVAVGSSWQKN